MASLGLDLGDDDMLNDGNDGRSYMRQSSPPASGLPRVHCVVHSGGDLHTIHTAVMVMLGAARTRTGDRRRALYRRRHTGHDMVERRVHEANAARGRPRRDGLWRRTPTRPMAPSATGASGTIVRGRCRPPEQLAGCTPCGRVVDTSPARGLGFTL